uniref:MOG2B acyltransferase n=1 Tax=Anser cygnoides TaxID=8845 RepID=A0A8B9EKQ3_ANSCY
SGFLRGIWGFLNEIWGLLTGILGFINGIWGFPKGFGHPSRIPLTPQRLRGFPKTFRLVRTAELDPCRNYVFGFHPHGVLAAGAFANFCTEATGFGVLFPGLRPHLLTLPCWFRLPLLRDYMLSGGLVSSEKASLEFLLSRPGGGQVAVIAVGGPPESLDARPGALRLQLLGRKGFVRIALEHG